MYMSHYHARAYIREHHAKQISFDPQNIKPIVALCQERRNFANPLPHLYTSLGTNQQATAHSRRDMHCGRNPSHNPFKQRHSD